MTQTDPAFGSQNFIEFFHLLIQKIVLKKCYWIHVYRRKKNSSLYQKKK